MTTARPARRSITQRLRQLVEIGIALTSERDLAVLLDRIVTEARRFTGAEAGTLFLREAEQLRVGVVQDDRLAPTLGDADARRPERELLDVAAESVAAYVAASGQVVRLAGAHAPDADGAVPLERAADACPGSVLAVPVRAPGGAIVGVLALVDARDDDGRLVAFAPEDEDLVAALAAQAAVAIRNARLEELSFKDSLTGAYNRRYFAVRIEEEARRQARLDEPLSLVLLDIDHFKPVNDRLGHDAGDDVLREVSQLLIEHSRSFSIVTRYGGDEFAVLLLNTAKSGALRYAQRIKRLIETHVFTHGRLTVSLGVASLPEDVAEWSGLIPAADRALYAAKRLGRNAVESA